MKMKMTKNILTLATALLPLLSGYAQAPAPPVSYGSAPAPGMASVPANISPAAAEIIKLAEAGTGDDVLLAYIQNSASPFGLTTDQILYLRDVGLSSPVIAAMLSHDGARTVQPPASPLYQPAYPPSAQPAPVPVPVPQTIAPAPAAVPPPVYVSSPPADVTYFYDGLAPYGSWVQLEGVGWCWQPRVVVINRGWRPYSDGGHWIYSDAGWYWQSDYSWGWAPFHYGRWYPHPRSGWVWVPDRVWGPAWVLWRSGDEHCGWAPLPPHADFDVRLGWRFNGVTVGVNFDFGLHADQFTFIALKDFNNHDFAHHRLPPTEVTRFYGNTTVINSVVVNNRTIVNEGIKLDRVTAATHTEFRKATIRDLPAGASGMARPQPAERNNLVVYRPQLQAPARPSHMVAQRVDDSHPTVQHLPIAPARSVGAASPGAAPVAAPAPAITGARATQTAAPRTSPPSSRPVSPAYTQPPNSHVYYPKSYQQASEAHILPPRDSRPSASSSPSPDDANSRSKDKEKGGGH
jgi:hypothetical protein